LARELPPEVAATHSLDRWLPLAGSGEAGALAELDGGALLLKVYREGAWTDDTVRRQWGELHASGVVRLHQHGVHQNRRWELMDRVPGESLLRVLQTSPGGLGPEAARCLIERLADVLDELGEKQIAHLDLRPENLVAAVDRPWEATLVDFGVALHLAQPVMKGSLGISPAYAAPEVLVQTATAASDWWSLGILVAELLTGRHPGGEVPGTIALWVVRGERLADPGLPEDFLPLWEGLTRPGYEERWQAAEVRTWLAGGTVPRPARPAGEQGESGALPRVAVADQPFVFLDQEHYTRAALADSIRANWPVAQQQFFGRGPESSAWAELSNWLQQFPAERDSRSGPDVVRHVEQAAAGADPWSPSALLLRLLHDLDPWSQPRYQSWIVGADLLRMAAAFAIGADGSDALPAGRGLVEVPSWVAGLFDDFWRWPLLTEVDGTRETDGFAALDQEWHRLHRLWERWVDELVVTNPPAHDAVQGWPGSVTLRAHLLLLALDPRHAPRHAQQLAVEVTAVRAAVRATRGGEPLDWYEAVAALPDGVGALVGFAAGASARAEAAAEADERAALRRDAATRSQLREWREFWRAFDRPVAVGWAGAGLAVTTGLWVVTLLIVDLIPAASDATVIRAWTLTAVAVVLQAGIEAWVSLSIGGPYHPAYSLFAELVRSARTVTRRFGTSWIGSTLATVLLGLGTVVAAAVVTMAPYLPAALIPVLHLWSALRRYRRWCADHQAELQPDDDAGDGGAGAEPGLSATGIPTPVG
jgi:serine/threonine protein kinase